MKLYKLDNLIAEVCPIFGINTNGDISFKPEATEEQKKAARSLMDAHLVEVELGVLDGA